MKESLNQINIEGIVSEINLREITKEDKNYVCGDVVVQVNDADGNVNMIPVSFISADKKANGELNKNYARLLGLKEFNSIASSGIDLATKVQIRNAKAAENAFYAQNSDQVVSFTRINSNFFTKINDTNFNPMATFNFTGCIVKMEDEQKNTNGEMQETGRLIINMAIVQYGDKVDVIKLIAEKPEHIDFIRANWNEGNTVRVGGNIRYTEENVEVEQESGFGDAEVRKYTKRIREFIIKRGSAGPLEEEESYSNDDIKAGLLNRKQLFEKVKNDALSKTPKSNNSNTQKSSGGFTF
jgi:hypothetical protein